ncbi:MAG: zf-HC2 domain-containing protein [Ardenticatenia bacterium]|nr:zf-HC2 domain-containing protein [Ardenticatenia bacterium]
MRAGGERSVAHIHPEQLSAYLDGELSEEERRQVEVHLGVCVACREDVEELRWVVELVSTLPSVEVPRPFYVRQADLAPTAHVAPNLSARLAGFFRALSYASGVVTLFLALITAFSAISAPRPAADLVRSQGRVELSGAPEEELEAFKTQGEATTSPWKEVVKPPPPAGDDDGVRKAEVGLVAPPTVMPDANAMAEGVAATPMPTATGGRPVRPSVLPLCSHLPRRWSRRVGARQAPLPCRQPPGSPLPS